MDATAPARPFEAVRCTCGNTLWRAYPLEDLIEVAHRVKGGADRFSMALPLQAARQTLIPCVRCGTRWWPADLTRARLPIDGEAALAVAADRPAAEVQTIVRHNSDCHHGEDA